MSAYRIIDKLAAIFLLAALACGAAGQGGLPQAGPEIISAEAVSSHVDVTAGQTFHVAVPVTIEHGWVFYSPKPVVTPDYEPIAAELRVEGGDLQVVEVRWPMDEFHPNADFGDSYAYEDRMVVYVALRVPPAAPAGLRTIRLALDGQVCGELCILAAPSVSVDVAVGSKDAANPAWPDELAEGFNSALTVEQLRQAHQTSGGPDYSAWAGLGLALLAGLILNVMPCVLPVIPIRILSIVQSAGGSRRRFVVLGLAFAAGICLFFAAMAAVNVGVRVTTSQALDWGRHFQSTAFRVGMSLLLVALAANLFGAFAVIVPRRIAGIDARPAGGGSQVVGSLGMGVMMAILSTPCSFAILVLAMAWAQVQPLWLGTLAIVFVGVGMAAPHALLTAFPALVDRLPKPGRWMELLRQGMGFAILAFAVWLIGTLVQAESGYAVWVMGYAVVLAAALWIWGTWVRFDASLRRKVILRGLALVLAVGGGWVMLSPPGEPVVKMEHFDAAGIESARQDGQIVLVKFTAAWCLSCRVVEATVYSDQAVADALTSRNVLAMNGDVTKKSDPASDYLYGVLKGAVPLTVVYSPGDAKPIRLVGKFSKDDLFEALDQASGQ